MDGGIKKWFMLQMWRLQQVAQLLTIALLAINLSLQVYTFMEWRGSLFATPYTGVPIILLILAAIIWGFAIVWDMRLKMWRESQAVLIERNPYQKEKMSSKELALYGMCWLPILKHLGETDPEARQAEQSLRAWLKRNYESDSILRKDLGEVFEFIGTKQSELLESMKK